MQPGYVFAAVQIQQRLQPRLVPQVGQNEMRDQLKSDGLAFGKHPAFRFSE